MAPRDHRQRNALRLEIGGSLLLLIAVGGGLWFFLFHRSLDFALLDAAAKNDIQTALRALAAGANPNFRGVPGETGISRLVAPLPPSARSASKGAFSSALSLAEDRRAKELVTELLRRGALPENPEQYTPAKVEPVLRKHPARWLQEGDLDEEDRLYYDDDTLLCRQVLALHPGCGRAALALGETLLLAGEYREARDVLQRAVNSLPNDPRAVRALSIADQCLPAAVSIQRQLPAAVQLFQLRRLPTQPGAPLRWAALTEEVEDAEDEVSFSYRSGLCLSLWREERGTLQSYAKVELAESGNVTFQLRDLTGDGIPEATVMTAQPGAGWSDAHLWIFTCEPDRLVPKLELSSKAELWMRDLDRDGRPEIFTTEEIGVELPHVGQPRWNDIYRWKNGRYGMADQDFPLAYRELDQEITEALQYVPNDWELWQYLGMIRSFQRRPTEAKQAFREALKFLAQQTPTEAEEREYLEKAQREIRTRLAALGRTDSRRPANRQPGK